MLDEAIHVKDGLQAKHDAMTETVTTMLNDMNETQVQNRDLVVYLAKADAEWSQKKTQLSVHEAHGFELQQTLDRFRERYRQVDRECAKLRQQHAKATTRRDTLQMSLDEARREMKAPKKAGRDHGTLSGPALQQMAATVKTPNKRKKSRSQVATPASGDHCVVVDLTTDNVTPHSGEKHGEDGQQEQPNAPRPSAISSAKKRSAPLEPGDEDGKNEGSRKKKKKHRKHGKRIKQEPDD